MLKVDEQAYVSILKLIRQFPQQTGLAHPSLGGDKQMRSFLHFTCQYCQFLRTIPKSFPTHPIPVRPLHMPSILVADYSPTYLLPTLMLVNILRRNFAVKQKTNNFVGEAILHLVR
jgi:hypothetical protein